MVTRTALRIAVVGAGPIGLTVALLLARTMPHTELTLFDARSVDQDVSQDPRTLALSLGSVQLLQRLGVWSPANAAPILNVQISQAPPSLGDATVLLSAAEQGVPMLGAVMAYGHVLAPLQAAWMDQGSAPRLTTRFGTPVRALRTTPGGVDVETDRTESFDLAVVAEGGVFGEQARKTVVQDYGQTAWVGTVVIDRGTPGLAFERFTTQGPAALLPLPPAADGRQRAALVWCVPSADDPVRALDDAQRLAVLNTLFPPEAGRMVSLSPLKDFALGLNAERSLVDGRSVRIGNAAQTLHPVAGQGLNLGLRDAFQLVQNLRDQEDVDRALRQFVRDRAPDRWGMVGATDFLARSFTWRAPGLATARGLGLAALQALGPVKRRLAHHMMFGWR